MLNTPTRLIIKKVYALSKHFVFLGEKSIIRKTSDKKLIFAMCFDKKKYF